MGRNILKSTIDTTETDTTAAKLAFGMKKKYGVRNCSASMTIVPVTRPPIQIHTRGAYFIVVDW